MGVLRIRQRSAITNQIEIRDFCLDFYLGKIVNMIRASLDLFLFSVSKACLLTTLICISLSPNLSFSEESKNKIGVVIPLTGVLATYGEALANGCTLASEDLGASHGEVILEDSQTETRSAVSAFNKLLINGAKSIFIWGTTPNEAIAPLAQQNGVPLLAASVSAAISKNRSNVLRTSPHVDMLVGPIKELLLKRGVKSISMIVTEWSYTEELRQSFKRLLPEVQFDEHVSPRSDSDFRTVILKQKATNPDYIAVLLGAGQIRQYFQQAQQLGLKAQFVGSNFFSDSVEMRASGPLAEGAVFTDTEVCDSFKSRYLNRFGKIDHITTSIAAYDNLSLLLKLGRQGKKYLLTNFQ